MSTPQAAPPPGGGWVKSSLSFANGNRDASGAVLAFTPDEWHAFLGGVRNGEFDRFGRSGA